MEILNSSMKKNFEKIDLKKNSDLSKNHLIKNNYSVSNIPNMKIKKVVLPLYINNKNRIQSARNLQYDNKRLKKLPKNQSFSSTKKSFLFNKSEVEKSLFGITKKNRDKYKKIKEKAESARTIKYNPANNVNENLESLMLIKAKGKNVFSNNVNHSGKGKKRSSSFHEEKNTKDEQNQSRFKKSFYTKHKFGELLLMNYKNYKKSSKI
jgi:dsDNA-binding SOS-regulon protein